MPVSLTGEVGVYGTTGDPTFATAPVPANGDDVDAAIVISTMQRLLDFDAQLAFDVNGLYEQVTARIDNGVPILRNVASIAALKALSTGATPDGGVAVVKDATITGSDISRVGLFVYDSTSTQAECAIPGIVDAYLVVTPDSGTGRWFNVAASVGWNGTTGEFLPRPKPRAIPWQISGNAASPSTITYAVGWLQLPPVVAPVLETGDTFVFDFDFSAGFDDEDNEISFRVEVSYNGGSYAPVVGCDRRIGLKLAGTVGAVPYHQIHISGTHSASSGAGTYTFRVKCSQIADSDVVFWGSWTARGIQYLAA